MMDGDEAENMRVSLRRKKKCVILLVSVGEEAGYVEEE